MSKKLWTIGHSTHPIEEFISILHAYHIEMLVDIRSLPGSNKFPQFNKENLEISLPKEGISYQHLAILGGRRKVSKTSKNTAWRNASFRGYADYMETDAFKEGIEELKKLAEHKKVAIMCSEVLWWRCHRSMIADELKSEGWTVIHILSLSKSEEHPYTAPAKIVDGKLSYKE
jgi:uncharacterized protein (DUF488 family)